jgi:hypothetical protein
LSLILTYMSCNLMLLDACGARQKCKLPKKCKLTKKCKLPIAA